MAYFENFPTINYDPIGTKDTKTIKDILTRVRVKGAIKKDHSMFEKYDIKLLGSSIETIKKSEDREGFKELMKEISEPVPESAIANSVQESKEIAISIGLPVVVRPAFTLGGTGGGMANTLEELEKIAESGIKYSPINQILIEKS